MNRVVMNNVSIGYDAEHPIKKGINLSFENKIYAITGESGGGKTTLLETIARIKHPLSGTITTTGKICMVHQHYANFPWLSTLDNVLISNKIAGLPNDFGIDFAKYLLNKVGLAGCEDKYPSELSGGMNQRLAIIRTLMMQPSVLLMDEPLSALDEQTRSKMQKFLMDWHCATNGTIIFVTHSQDEANKMADKIIRMEDL